MDSKKISFGFSKISKKPLLLQRNKIKDEKPSKVELIKYLEGQEIKLVEEKTARPFMIIPLKVNTKTSSALASLIKRRAVLLDEPDDPPPVDSDRTSYEDKNVVNDCLKDRAIRELLASVSGEGNEKINQHLVVTANNADELPLDGAIQSSIDDYENVPIEQFGKAMLRGMGWVEPIQKKGDTPTDDAPFVRPKGMGLGADKALKKQALLIAPEKNEVLEIKKLAYVKILGGKHKDMYGQIEGFDDHGGRVIVKMAIGGAKVAFNEFLCQPISTKEYAQYGKCINTTKYEEYKKMENEHGQIIIKKENIKNRSFFEKEYKLKSEYKKEDDKSSEKNYREKYDERRKKDENKFHRQGTGNARDIQCKGRFEYASDGSRELGLEERGSCSRLVPNDDIYNDRRKSECSSRDRSSQNYGYEKSNSSSRHQHYAADTTVSSDTDSDSDCAYERRHKKRANHKAKAKKSSKRKHRRKTTCSEDSANIIGTDNKESRERRRRQHRKKKTKKSKKPRSRSSSHDRNNKR